MLLNSVIVIKRVKDVVFLEGHINENFSTFWQILRIIININYLMDIDAN